MSLVSQEVIPLKIVRGVSGCGLASYMSCGGTGGIVQLCFCARPALH